MSNSNLVNYTKLSPHCNKPRNNKIQKITIHHTAGIASVEGLGNLFIKNKSSANYGIGSDGRVGMYVEEANRAWTSSNRDNDMQAITIEVSNDGGAPDWHVSDKVMNKLIDLCVDICKRNNIDKLNYTGTKDGNLTMHSMFANTECPGAYLKSKFKYIADEVNKKLSPSITKKSVEAIAKEVIQGKWGNGLTRKTALEKAGYNYSEVQRKVEKLINPKTNVAQFATVNTKKSIEKVAKEVIQGKWGNGLTRKTALEKAGYNYSEVQRKVEKLLK